MQWAQNHTRRSKQRKICWVNPTNLTKMKLNRVMSRKSASTWRCVTLLWMILREWRRVQTSRALNITIPRTHHRNRTWYKNLFWRPILSSRTARRKSTRIWAVHTCCIKSRMRRAIWPKQASINFQTWHLTLKNAIRRSFSNSSNKRYRQIMSEHVSKNNTWAGANSKIRTCKSLRLSQVHLLKTPKVV